MSRIVVVHGIGQQNEGPHTLHERHFPALRQGLSYAGTEVSGNDVTFCGYGRVFRPEAEVLAPETHLDASDVDDLEAELLAALWRRAAEVDRRVVPPDEEVLARSPLWAQSALNALNRSVFLSGIAERLFIADLRQVRRYLTDAEVRERVQVEVRAAVTDRTEVVVGHSLGSVVAYEFLCANQEPRPRALVTLGSPLGLRHVVFDRLRPAPRDEGGSPCGAWPGSGRTWTNIADSGDVVAVVEDLRPLFGPDLKQVRVHNGAHAHDMNPYLTDRATGEAIAEAMR